MTELNRREQQLRRKAKSKGLFIEKLHWIISVGVRKEKHFGYNIGREQSRCIISGYHGLPSDTLTLEQAEFFVENF